MSVWRLGSLKWWKYRVVRKNHQYAKIKKESICDFALCYCNILCNIFRLVQIYLLTLTLLNQIFAKRKGQSEGRVKVKLKDDKKNRVHYILSTIT